MMKKKNHLSSKALFFISLSLILNAGIAFAEFGSCSGAGSGTFCPALQQSFSSGNCDGVINGCHPTGSSYGCTSTYHSCVCKSLGAVGGGSCTQTSNSCESPAVPCLARQCTGTPNCAGLSQAMCLPQITSPLTGGLLNTGCTWINCNLGEGDSGCNDPGIAPNCCKQFSTSGQNLYCNRQSGIGYNLCTTCLPENGGPCSGAGQGNCCSSLACIEGICRQPSCSTPEGGACSVPAQPAPDCCSASAPICVLPAAGGSSGICASCISTGSATQCTGPGQGNCCSGASCINGMCTPDCTPNGQACPASPGACCSGKCENGQCASCWSEGHSCSASIDCCSGECDGGNCVSCYGSGHSCTMTGQCCSGLGCISGSCQAPAQSQPADYLFLVLIIAFTALALVYMATYMFDMVMK